MVNLFFIFVFSAVYGQLVLVYFRQRKINEETIKYNEGEIIELNGEKANYNTNICKIIFVIIANKGKQLYHSYQKPFLFFFQLQKFES